MTRRTLLQASLARAARAPELAVTMDDFNWQLIPNPFGAVANRTLLDTLEAHQLKTALFVVGRNIETDEGRSLLGAWDDAAHMIGNHTYSHRNFHGVALADFEADVLHCDSLLKSYGSYGRFFRFPLLKEGETAVKRDAMRAFLAQQQMHNGHVTIDASDWYYDAELRKHLAADPAYDVSLFRAPYLNHLLDRALYYDRLARSAIGRSPRHTLLLHYNLINVLFLNDALSMFTDHGWKLISAPVAYRDPVFQSVPLTVPAGESLIWALAKQSGRFEGELRYPGEDDTYEKAQANLALRTKFPLDHYGEMKPSTFQEPPPNILEIALSWTVAGTPRSLVTAPGTELLSRWATRLESFWRYPVLQYRAASVALFLVLATVCALRASIGLSGFQVFTPDAFMPLDGAWRMLNGQRPHIDFYSFMGVLVYLPTLLGLLLCRGGVEGFAYGQALVGLCSGFWAYLLTRKRLPDVPAVLFCLCLVLLATAPFPLGHSPLFISPATTYNRYGYAALALIFLEAVVQRQHPAHLREFSGGFSTGALLVMLFFLKITFFGAALFLIGAFTFCRTQTARRWAGFTAGCAALSLGFGAYFGFQLMPMLSDLVMVAGAKRVFARAYQLDSILSDTGTLLSFTALTALLLILQKRSASARSIAIAAAALCFAGTVLIFGSSEPHGAPLAIFLVLVAISQLTFYASGLTHLVRCGVLLWGTVFAITAMAPSAIGFGYATLLSIQARQHEIPMAGPTLAKFIPTGTDAGYRAFVNDGIALINQHRVPGDTLMSLEFSNPFSFGLQMKPARGGATTLDYQTTFSDEHRPSPEWLLGSASLVMVPKIYSHPSRENILRIYGPYLCSHFHPVGESRQWRIYRANQAAPGTQFKPPARL